MTTHRDEETMADDVDRTELRERLERKVAENHRRRYDIEFNAAHLRWQDFQGAAREDVDAVLSVLGPERLSLLYSNESLLRMLERQMDLARVLQGRITRALYELRRGGQPDSDRQRATDRILSEGDSRG